MNPNGKASKIVKNMKSLDKPYKPTPWLVEHHTHTVWGMRYRPRSRITEKCTREMFKFEDGGTSALDYFAKPDTPEKGVPFVIIDHTLGGGTREPCVNNFAEACINKGWRCVVANNRGCSGAPLTAAKLSSALDISDLKEIVKHIREIYEPSYLFICGFSLGAMQTMEYTFKERDVDAVCCVSHTYDALNGSLILSTGLQAKLYTPIIMAKLKHILKKDTFVSCPAALKTKFMHEFDDEFTSHQQGYKDYKEYYGHACIYEKIPVAHVPTLLLGADDDPFTLPKYLPIKEVRSSENVVLAHVKEGGHVSFCSGLDGQDSLVDRIVPDWFEAVIQTKTQ